MIKDRHTCSNCGKAFSLNENLVDVDHVVFSFIRVKSKCPSCGEVEEVRGTTSDLDF